MASVTAHDRMGEMLIHELGHSHAALADEYFQPNTPATDLAPGFGELWPNISVTNDLAAIKWKRWLDVPGVGAFQGGANFSTGVWRPTLNSFMRVWGNAVDPIGAEAWAVKTYERAGGAILAATPAFGAVTAPASSPVLLSIRTLYPGEGQSVRWFLDDTEIVEAADRRAFSCCEGSPGPHTVRVEARDSTGLIRLPDALPFYAAGIWTISFE